MHVTKGSVHHEDGNSVLVRDKRGQRRNPSEHEGDWLPISELGSKAVYQVYAERFLAVTPYR
jgi:hypothetical protein